MNSVTCDFEGEIESFFDLAHSVAKVTLAWSLQLRESISGSDSDTLKLLVYNDRRSAR